MFFNGFVYRLSFCFQGQHFDIFMDNVDMIYMNIMICWNIIMVMCIYFGPAIDVCRRSIFSKPWPYNLYNLPNKTINESLLFIICLFLILPRIVLVVYSVSFNVFSGDFFTVYIDIERILFIFLISLRNHCFISK